MRINKCSSFGADQNSNSQNPDSQNSSCRDFGCRDFSCQDFDRYVSSLSFEREETQETPRILSFFKISFEVVIKIRA